jgi:hypothetical protein
MPPTVAQTAPAFADTAGESICGPGANLAHRAEHEDRSVVLPKLLPLAQDFHDELHGYKSREVRAFFQQLDADWTRRVLLPTPPSAFNEGDWSRDFSLLYDVKPVDAEPFDFARPIVTLLAYDENAWPRRWEWLYAPQTLEQDLPSRPPAPPAAFEDGEGSRDFTEKRSWLESDVLLGVPLLPFAGWFEEGAAAFRASPGSLAALVPMDDFVNAPAGGSSFGAAPRGRTARFGFSISAFR